AAQSCIYAAHFQTDVAAAYHQQRGRHFLYLQRCGRVHQPGALEVHALQRDRAGAGGQYSVLELDAGRCTVAERLYAQISRVLECGSTVDDLHTRALAHTHDALRELIRHPPLPGAQLIDVDFWFAEVDAENRCML